MIRKRKREQERSILCLQDSIENNEDSSDSDIFFNPGNEKKAENFCINPVNNREMSASEKLRVIY